MSDEQDGVRRRFSAQEKVAILREHFIDMAPVSEVCGNHGLQPTALYRWQKEFFENGATAFEGRRSGGDTKARQLEEREAKIARKDEVIAELVEDHVHVRKSLGESWTAPGRSRTFPKEPCLP
jgi:transposase-like protein